MEYEDVTKRIIGCAFKVYNQMGYGFLESVYEKCLLIELAKAKITAESQKTITVYYENAIVGDFIADIIVENRIIIELKSVRKIIPSHEVQLVNYLNATQKNIGLLINFGPTKVEVKRKTRKINIS